MIKKIASFITAGAMFAAMAVPSFAVDCTVLATGPLSKNICKVEKENKVKFIMKNKSRVTTNQTSGSNTGGNLQTLITTSTGTGIGSGNAGSMNTGGSDVNTTDATVDQGGSLSWTGMIDTTGPSSVNKTSNKTENKVYVSINNNSKVNTTQNSTAITGDNSQSLITVLNGGITTGNAASSNDNTVFANHTTINITQ